MNRNYDIIVAGGGPGGVCAAIAAARKGLSVLLVEKYGFTGGMATAGLVNPFMPYRSKTGNTLLPAAVFMQIMGELESAGGLSDGVTFDDELLKIILDKLLQEAGVKLLFHTVVCGAKSSGGTISEITVAGKDGLSTLSATVFIDATGDGDLASLAGFECEKGRAEDHACQPMTLCFRLGGVDTADWWQLHQNLNTIFHGGKQSGRISDPREDVLIFRTLQPNVVHFNTTRVIGRDGSDTQQLGEAEMIGRKQVQELYAEFKAKSSYCKDAYIMKMAAQIGVRETRRVIGGYVLDVEDVIQDRTFEDGIARSSYPIDIHNPSGSGTVIKSIEGEYYEIPYRCLVPRGSRNLLMACRAVSATHEAHSSLRIMPVVASLGEAAGLAAAEAVARHVGVADVDGAKLKETLFQERV